MQHSYEPKVKMGLSLEVILGQQNLNELKLICCLFQEVLFQTKFMRTILAATENHCLHDDIEILCPSISRENLEFLVQFLYKGSIPCSDNAIGNLLQGIDNKTVKIIICLT